MARFHLGTRRGRHIGRGGDTITLEKRGDAELARDEMLVLAHNSRYVRPNQSDYRSAEGERDRYFVKEFR